METSFAGWFVIRFALALFLRRTRSRRYSRLDHESDPPDGPLIGPDDFTVEPREGQKATGVGSICPGTHDAEGDE